MRNVFCEVRSIGPNLGAGICSVPSGKIEKCMWKIGRTCGAMSAMIMSETKTPKASGGQGEIEPAQSERGQGDEPAHEGGHHDSDDHAPHGHALAGARTGQPEVEHDDGGDRTEGDGARLISPA